jgi:3-hydroxyisobutyrate dehydrogenase-like beta-hydroxyacid dehydrogenase
MVLSTVKSFPESQQTVQKKAPKISEEQNIYAPLFALNHLAPDMHLCVKSGKSAPPEACKEMRRSMNS